MNKIKVSVIVPVYNVKMYLEECLNSLISQTLKGIEIICVDDASTDGSQEILSRYGARYDNIQIIRQPHNKGLAAARNVGSLSARGEYIYFLDSDDWIESKALETLYKKASKDQLDMLFFDTCVFGEGVEKKQFESYKKYYLRTHKYPEVLKGSALFAEMKFNREYLCSACLYMTRREFINDNKLTFLEGIIHEDELYTFQALMKAERCGYMAEKYYHRRLHAQSIMTKKKTFDNVKGLLMGAWYGAESLTDNYSKVECREINLHLMEMSRYAMTIYRGLDSREQSRIKELPLSAQLRMREMLMSAENNITGMTMQNGMLVYGSGAHLADMLEWHPELRKKIIRVFDKDPEKVGLKADGLDVFIESPEQLKSLPSGTQVAVSALRYYDEIVKEIHVLNPGLICPDIDEAYRQLKQKPLIVDKIEKKSSKVKPSAGKHGLTDLQRLRMRGGDAQARWRQGILLASNGCRHIFWGVKGIRATYLRRLFQPMMRQGDFFIDDDMLLRGQMLDGIPICVPEILKDVHEKLLIVVLSENYEQIRIRLMDYGYVENVNFVEGRRLLGEDETGYLNLPCVDKATEGMIVYGWGAHLMDMFKWHPELALHIKRVIDKDKKKIGICVPKCGVPVEYTDVLRLLPAGTEIAVAAIRYIDEIIREVSIINSGLICRNIDDIWQEYV